MESRSGYHKEWFIKRFTYLLNRYPAEFFSGKTILDLGANWGDIHNFFTDLGAHVTSVEGRQENIDKAKETYPDSDIILYDLDTPKWPWGKFDIIINFGLYYHLEHFHKEHLQNCLKHCDLMFFETVVYDSFESELYWRTEEGFDQSLTSRSGTPSTSYVEDILTLERCKFEKISDEALNAPSNHHTYSWEDTGQKVYEQHSRRMWIITP